MRPVAVPATPVVVIAVDGDRVTLNGQLVEHDGTRPAHEVAVHTVAVRVAQTLKRPVRAIAEDATGRTHFVIHEDGSASDFQTEQALVPVSLVEPASDVTGAPAPARVPATEAEESTTLDALMTSPARGGDETTRSRRPIYLAALVAAAALVTAGGGYATVQAMGSNEPREAPSQTPPPQPVESSTTPEAVAPTPIPTVAAPTPAPLLRAKAVARRQSVEVRLLARPANKVIVRLVLGKWSKTKTVRINSRGTVTFANVPAGRVRWRVAAGALKTSGDVAVKAPPAAPARPRFTAPPAPVAPRTYKPSSPRATAPAPAPRPTPSKPRPKPRSEPKGSGPKAPGQKDNSGPRP